MVSYDNGTAWRTLRPPVVTALPANPVDGDEVLFLADPSGIIWHLRYVAASTGTYKWVFLGGAAFDMEITTAETRGPVGTAGAWANLNSPPVLGATGCEFTTPLAGIYLARFGLVQALSSGAVVTVTLAVINRSTLVGLSNVNILATTPATGYVTMRSEARVNAPAGTPSGSDGRTATRPVS